MNMMLATVQVASITGRPERIQIRVVIGKRVFSLSDTVTTLAVLPIGVPLPPNPAGRITPVRLSGLEQ